MQSADCVPCSLQTAYLAPCSLQTAQVLRLHATYILVHFRCCYFLSRVFVSCHVFGSSRHVFPFCIHFYVPVSCCPRLSCVSVFAFVSLFCDWLFVHICQSSLFTHTQYAFISLIYSSHFSFHRGVLTSSLGERIKDSIAKNRLYYFLALSQGFFGLQHS